MVIMRDRLRKIANIVLLMISMLLLTGCCDDAKIYENFEVSNQGDSMLLPVDSYYTKDTYIYEDNGIVDECIFQYESVDGLCVIKKMEHYYDVILDYERGTPRKVGEAYANTILKAFPEYENIMEPYIYENIRFSFPDLEENYEAVNIRLNTLLESIADEYREEIEGYAEVISKGEHGFSQDGKISYEEALLVQIVPDALRGTACSAVSLWGDKTVTGNRITFRSLEWILGSNNQMCMAHAVVHMKKEERSITSLNMLGLLNVVSAINDDGVFVGIIDAGARETYIYEGKKCYTYELRYALEEFQNATELGNYMVNRSADYTWCHNIIISDEKKSYCAEDAVQVVQEKGRGYSILRDENTPLMDGLRWDSTDSLCVVNSFASIGNLDGFCGNSFNIVRFAKYNEWVSSRDKFSVADVKNMVTQESVDQDVVSNVHPNGESAAYQQILVDYNTKRVQVAFTGIEGVVDKPRFIDIGGWNE